ncbi:MAG: hypothetical protein LBC46_06925, partial [Treponema sp.]|nr:hypothetical protein [Treponema sp.]
NLDFGAELKLNGVEDNNSKNKDDPEEGEGDFKGMDFHFTAVYTLAPVTLRVALLGEGFASAVSPTLDPLVSAGARLIFDIPNAEGSPLDLGDPWVQLQMLPNENISATVKKESFKDMDVAFEWEPSYSIIQSSEEAPKPITLKALLWFGVNYKSWHEVDSEQEKHPLEFAVRPKLEFKFAKNATLGIYDKVWVVQQTSRYDKGKRTIPADGSIKNEIGLRFEWAF